MRLTRFNQSITQSQAWSWYAAVMKSRWLAYSLIDGVYVIHVTCHA